MNLKEAAQSLAVHYQTAYRWVRDGELVAVKVGNRYEVSEAAIEQFISRRASLLASPVDRAPSPAAANVAADELSELRVLARETRATAQACFNAAAVLAGTRTGGAAVLRLLDDSGQQLRPVASFAAAPELRAAVIGAVAAGGDFPRTTPHWLAAEQSADVHVVHHMPRDLVRDLFGEEGRFAGHGVQILAAAVAPMFIEGDFVGGLLAVKITSHLPFSDDEISLLRDTAALCREALHKAAAFRRTWQSNTSARDRATAWFVAGSEPEALTAVDADLLDPDRAQALVSPEGVVLASTHAFESLASPPTSTPGSFLGRWNGGRVEEVVSGMATQIDLNPLDPRDPGLIVSDVRRPDAELLLLVADVIAY